MSLKPRITNEVERLIATVYQEHRDWLAKEIQLEVNTRLHKIRPEVPDDWPGVSAIQKRLTEYRRKETEANPLDDKWDIYSIVKYPVAPEALPIMLMFSQKASEEKPFTIREAQWVGRLYVTIKERRKLYAFATFCADNERVTELTGIPAFDPFEVELDTDLWLNISDKEILTLVSELKAKHKRG
jgi:hypothetical protein